LFSYNCKVVDAEKYVPPVITVSLRLATFHLAFSLVTPLTPSIVDPVHAFINALPASLVDSQSQFKPVCPKDPEV